MGINKNVNYVTVYKGNNNEYLSFNKYINSCMLYLFRQLIFGIWDI